MFGSIFGIATDLIKVAAAPVEIAADLALTVTKPVADAAKEVAKEVKEATKDIREG